ncbi:MAG TPA: SDR family NAD(P)-dependent oxidoreductase [Syntrophorhabdales bacterium]|nr:SDR family NAD(P)-dependent oxidoreductase [Syntrophorhabdales bacterium]
MLLEDKVAIITGGAKGMGEGIALKFAQEGCCVVIGDMDMAGAQAVADQIKALGRKSIAAKADITKSAEVEAMVAKTIEVFGKIDILVNNAGGVPGTHGAGSSETITEEEWDRIVAINLKGPFLVCKAVLPFMKKSRSGKIINLSSMGAVCPAVSVLHYHSAKAGVLGLTINLAFELAPLNIHVNAIVPGPVETPFWDNLMPKGPERDAFFKALTKKEVPLGRMGSPKDIAGAALFLASDLSDYMTGQILHVAGGLPLLSHEATFNIEAYLQKLNK